MRDAFISMNVLGSFGRYAESQFRKIERSERRNRAIADLLEAIEMLPEEPVNREEIEECIVETRLLI